MNSKVAFAASIIAAFAAAGLAGCGERAAENNAVATQPASLADRLNADSRPAKDRARDAGRQPADVIGFLGIEPGMRVLDLIAGGGYYTEVLSLAVGPEGSVVAENPAVVLQLRDGANDKELTARLADNRLPNVTRLDAEIPELTDDDGLYDAALTALNLHDIYNNRGDAGAIGALKTVYSLLKPGGILGLIDHHGIAGNDNKALHRIPKADAIRLARAAGFAVEADSGLLHRHSDDMSLNVFDAQVRGKTHRFLLRLRKPAE